jgi:hypothetical protein
MKIQKFSLTLFVKAGRYSSQAKDIHYLEDKAST